MLRKCVILICVIQFTVTGLTVDIIKQNNKRDIRSFILFTVAKECVQNFTKPYIIYFFGQCVGT